MKKIAFLLALGCLSGVAFGQSDESEINQDLKSFSRIIASPRISLVLEQGDDEKIRVEYSSVDKEKINVMVRNRTLHIFLDDARKVEPSVYNRRGHSRNMYAGVSVTAYVTYKYLEKLEIRGSQEIKCYGAIDAENFVIRAYGENKITLASLKTDFFKAALYGENTLTVSKGRVVQQKYRLFGENTINTQSMRSAFASASIFGEGEVKLNSSEEVRVDAFGEPDIYVEGGANVNKRLIFGKAYIYRTR